MVSPNRLAAYDWFEFMGRTRDRYDSILFIDRWVEDPPKPETAQERAKQKQLIKQLTTIRGLILLDLRPLQFLIKFIELMYNNWKESAIKREPGFELGYFRGMQDATFEIAAAAGIIPHENRATIIDNIEQVIDQMKEESG